MTQRGSSILKVFWLEESYHYDEIQTRITKTCFRSTDYGTTEQLE